jgi:hypothetical protein
MVSLSIKELKKFEIIAACLAMEITNAEAATILGVTKRHVKRLKVKVRRHGKLAVVHGLKNKQSNHHKKVMLDEK